MSDRLDMTLMYAMHNALRRELGHIAKITAAADDDPRRILANAVGWAMFKQAAPRVTPWVLDGADQQTVAAMLALLPEPVRAAYRDQWQPAYAAPDRWNATPESGASPASHGNQ